jgi:hypothetical protein
MEGRSEREGELNPIRTFISTFFFFFSLPSILPWGPNVPHQSSENFWPVRKKNCLNSHISAAISTPSNPKPTSAKTVSHFPPFEKNHRRGFWTKDSRGGRFWIWRGGGSD